MELLEIGKIVRAHGIKGGVKVMSYLDADFSMFKHVYVGTKKQNANILSCQSLNNDAYILKLDISTDCNSAESLKNFSIFVDRKEYPTLQDKVYLTDCLGLPLLDEKGEKLGELVDFDDYGASIILTIKCGAVSYSIPYVEEFVHFDNVKQAFITTKQKFEDLRV